MPTLTGPIGVGGTVVNILIGRFSSRAHGVAADKTVSPSTPA